MLPAPTTCRDPLYPHTSSHRGRHSRVESFTPLSHTNGVRSHGRMPLRVTITPRCPAAPCSNHPHSSKAGRWVSAHAPRGPRAVFSGHARLATDPIPSRASAGECAPPRCVRPEGTSQATEPVHVPTCVPRVTAAAPSCVGPFTWQQASRWLTGEGVGLTALGCYVQGCRAVKQC